MNMAPHKDFTRAAEILANAKATRAKFFTPVRPVPIKKPTEQQMEERSQAKHEFVMKPLWACIPTQFNSHVVMYYRWQLMTEEQRGRVEECPDGMQSIMDIIRDVLRKFPGVSVRDIKGHSRMKIVVLPRQIAMYEARKRRPDLSLPRLGQLFGGKDHTSILAAVRRVEKQISEGKLDWFYNARDTE